jgi:hypothetical protein
VVANYQGSRHSGGVNQHLRTNIAGLMMKLPHRKTLSLAAVDSVAVNRPGQDRISTKQYPRLLY